MERAHADQQHPLFLAVDRQREQVGAFPYAARIVALRAEFARLFPFLQVLRGIKHHPVTGCKYHAPAAFRIFENLGVTKISHVTRDHRVAFIFMEGDAIGRPGN